MVAAQKTVPFVPGTLSSENISAEGTSFTSPYICVTIADLAAKPGVATKRAVKALI